MVDQNGEGRSDVVSRERLAQVPKVSHALRKGVVVSRTTWSGREKTGVVCDRQQAGLLLDVREPQADSEGLPFLRWSSVERVKIREVAQGWVTFLPS